MTCFDFKNIIATDYNEILINKSGHNGSRRHARKSLIPLGERSFIAWDGEGTNGTKGREQNYSLFGSSTGDKIIAPSLSTMECLALIIKVGKANPNSFHIGFAFEYDVNMILHSMSTKKFRELKEKGTILYNRYRIEHVPNKWLQVTEYGKTYRDGNKNDKFTVRIADIFGFFQCSFVAACKSYIADDPLMQQLTIIVDGKAKRNSFDFNEIEFITAYWTVEIALLKKLVERLRKMLYRVDLYVSRWHGPGALANYVYKTNNIARHKQLCGEEVRNAARYGYAGGRFELFRLGRHEKVYGIDINSAYPAAISRLPSLSEGTWRYVNRPGTIQEFGIYHVRINGQGLLARKPSPLFHRDRAHNISYPWVTDGWYWSPEIIATKPLWDKESFEIVEGYEYVDWSTRPFGFVRDMYDQRRELKLKKDGSEKAIKLALNSLYGKMAQRVGWDRTGKPPVWHQLEWAGYVTSATRAKLFAVMARIPWDHLIGVETDGIYTTFDPSRLGIANSKILGEWEITEYQEMMYVQSGVYFAKGEDDQWTGKYRGLDSGTLNENDVSDYLRSLGPNPSNEIPWEPIKGPTTRFIGYTNALQREDTNRGPMKVHHCKWETTARELSTGREGKRRHVPKHCTACIAGANAYEKPHDLVIQSASVQHPQSEMHSIPWENKDNGATAEWRQYAETQEGLIMYG
jgi:hypothetical protein